MQSETDNKQSIIVFSTAYLPFVGGAELAIKEITDRVSDFNFFMVTCRMSRKLPKSEQIGNIQIRRVGIGIPIIDKLAVPFLGAWWAFSFSRKNRIRCYWSVMVTFASGAPFLLKILRLHRNTPILLTLQEGDSDEHIKQGRFGLIGISWRFALLYADHVHSISSYLAAKARGFGYRGAITIIPNGVDLTVFSALPKVAEREKIFPTLVTVSRLVEKNGVDILIRSLPEVKRVFPDLRCLIAGEGYLRQDLEGLSRNLGVSACVEFLGKVDYRNVPAVLQKGHIFIRPSRSEGLGTSFLEAMAAGIPVIAPPVGGIVDFLKDGETGIFVRKEDPADLAEKIILLCNDAELRFRIIVNARNLVEKAYAWENVALRIKTLITAL